MELEKPRAKRDEGGIRAEQEEAQLALSQEMNEQHPENTNQSAAKMEEMEKWLKEREAECQNIEQDYVRAQG